MRKAYATLVCDPDTICMAITGYGLDTHARARLSPNVQRPRPCKYSQYRAVSGKRSARTHSQSHEQRAHLSSAPRVKSRPAARGGWARGPSAPLVYSSP